MRPIQFKKFRSNGLQRVFSIVLSVTVFFFTVEVNAVTQSTNFHDVTFSKNIDYFGSAGEQGPQLATMFVDNEGVYAADVDNDYRSELFFLGGPEPRLYDYRDEKFNEVEEFPKFPGIKVNAAVFTDYNTDGFRDLVLVSQSEKIYLLKNTGGSFTKDRVISGPELQTGIGATAGDYNNDGCPDVFIIQYGPGSTDAALKQKRYHLGAKFRNLPRDNGFSNYLLTGNCNSLKYDSRDIFGRNHWSLAASFVDINGDGLSDLHVANDFYRDSIYLAQSDGSFEHKYLGRATDRNGMSSTITDFNQDGRPDIFVSNIYLKRDSNVFNWKNFTATITSDPYGHNALINKGEGNFEDRASKLGLQKGGWGWATIWADLTNNFGMDFLQSLQNHLAVPPSARQMRLDDPSVNQFIENFNNHRPIPETAKNKNPYWDEFQYWVGYQNVWTTKEGSVSNLKFKRRISRSLGRLNSRGIVSIDYDLDGDLDLVFSQFLNQFRVYQNNINRKRSQSTGWIKVHFQYPERGGRMILHNNKHKLTRPITSRTNFASQLPATYHVGLGDSRTLDHLEIVNHGSKTITLENIPTGTFIQVENNQVDSHVIQPVETN